MIPGLEDDRAADREETAAKEILDGLIRQRRALVAVSLVLVALVEIGATLDRIELLGNTITLARPLSLTFPLWVAWGYFLLRYYQYFRDLRDTGYAAVLEARANHHARRAGIKKLRTMLSPELSECKKPSWEIETVELEVHSSPPGFWYFKASGSIDIRDAARPSWGATQLFNGIEVYLKPGHPRFSRTRSVFWAMLHTRYATEYGLPFVVAALPVGIVILHRFGFRLF